MAVTARAGPAPGDDRPHWSQREVAPASGMSASTVNRRLRPGQLKPHPVDYWCGKRPDPEFEAK